MTNLDFPGKGLLHEVAEEFPDVICDGGRISIGELEAGIRLDPEAAARHRDLGRRMLRDAKPAIVSCRCAANRHAGALAVQQYRGGIADCTRVPTTQDFLTIEQSRLVATRGAVALNVVAVYRALGGGWGLRESQDLVPASIKDQMNERTKWGTMIDSDRLP